MKMTNFQLVFTGIFVAFIVCGVIAFSLYSAKGSSLGSVQIWGTVSGDSMQKLLEAMRQQDKDFQSVDYTQKPADTYINDVINAMASGTGPDIILLSQDNISGFSNKLLTIPYSTISQSTYTSSYIDEARLFLNSQGTVAMPFIVNPLVLYWNRDMFATAQLPQPPKFWDDLLVMAPKLTSLESANIKKSAVALGEWSNIYYAKAILATLFMQAGDAIVAPNANGYPVAVFGNTPEGATENPAASALQFYTEFANPSKVTYSWNRSLPSSKDSFVAGDLALYVGFASDYAELITRNPNLRFGVALLPQIQGNSTNLTFGQLTGLAIPRTSANIAGAVAVAQRLTSQNGISTASQIFGLPAVRFDVVADTSANTAAQVFYQSALVARSWLDPNTKATDELFQTMINSVTSNKLSPGGAVQEAHASLQALVPQNTQ
ncbi:MAG: extracellular solute-binding protein [Candidatus Adlerbacteria bacterium]